MKFSSDQLVEIAASEDISLQASKGSGLAAMDQALGGSRARERDHAAEAFYADATKLPRRPLTAYRHPEDEAAGLQSTVAQMQASLDTGSASRTRGPSTEPLSPADLAWLQRLPGNTDAISFEDARQLAGLAKRHSPGTSDGRLVHSIWAHVKFGHDERRLEAELTDAQRPYPPVPPSVVEALQDAVLRETTDLTPDEARVRGSARLREALAARDERRTRRIAEARSALTQLRLTRSERLATTR